MVMDIFAYVYVYVYYTLGRKIKMPFIPCSAYLRLLSNLKWFCVERWTGTKIDFVCDDGQTDLSVNDSLLAGDNDPGIFNCINDSRLLSNLKWFSEFINYWF